MRVLVVSDREYRKTTRGIDIITSYLAEKGHSVDHLVFFRRKKIPERQVCKNIRQLYFHDCLGIYRSKMRLFLPGFLLSIYFTYIIKKKTTVNFDVYNFIILESGYPLYLALVISGNIIYRQSDPVEIAFNSWRSFYRKLEQTAIQKALFVSSALQSIFYPPESVEKFSFWHSGFSPITTIKPYNPGKNFVFMGGGEIDLKLIKKIAITHPDYIFHIIGAFNQKYAAKNIVFHGYLEYDEYQKIVFNSSICIIPFSKRFVRHLKRCYFTAKILLPMSLGMPILLKGYGTIQQSDISKKLFVYNTNREALTLLDEIIAKTECTGIGEISAETLEFLRPQTTENRLKELDAIFTNWLQ
jgi:hypothetical protein